VWVPRLDRTILLTGALLAIAALLAWASLLAQTLAAPAANMGGMGLGEPGVPAAAAFVAAWGVMMAAMMLPSATPMIALYGAMRRAGSGTSGRGIPVTLFALVYLVLWAAFGLPIYVLGELIRAASSMQPAVAASLPYALGVVLLAAGAYQVSPWKQVCLRACRSPLSFLMRRTRSGYLGTLQLALDHALYCVGCCWALMVVLVAAGAMALAWVLLIAVVVFAEKLFPFGEWTARVVGVGLVLLGLALVLDPALAMTLRGQSMTM
jgi:predicted metal-binding membrane protein